jgi:hypothetical protein
VFGTRRLVKAFFAKNIHSTKPVSPETLLKINSQ